jgi:hypothetical protein
MKYLFFDYPKVIPFDMFFGENLAATIRNLSNLF